MIKNRQPKLQRCSTHISVNLFVCKNGLIEFLVCHLQEFCENNSVWPLFLKVIENCILAVSCQLFVFNNS